MSLDRISASEFRALPLAKKPKYRNKPTEVDGIKFASRKESRRWSELRLLERAGQITNLMRQQPFPLKVGGVLICTYICDFIYHDHEGRIVVEDVKSEITRRDPVYRIKAKLMVVLHQPITEV